MREMHLKMLFFLKCHTLLSNKASDLRNNNQNMQKNNPSKREASHQI